MIRIGILQLTQHLDDAVVGFKTTLAAEYAENIEYLYFNVEGRTALLPAYAEHLVQHNVDLIFSCSTPAAQAAIAAATPSATPVLFTPVFDPVGSGLVASLKHPGGIASGASGMVPPQAKLAFIKQLLPHLRTIGILFHAGDPNACLECRLFSEAAVKEGLKTLQIPITSAEQLSRLPDFLPAKLDALFLPIGRIVEENFATVNYYAEDAGLPIIASHAPNVDAGALAGLAANHKHLGILCGQMAARILSGAAVSELPVATPQQWDVFINTAVAANLGITIPADLQPKDTSKGSDH